MTIRCRSLLIFACLTAPHSAPAARALPDPGPEDPLRGRTRRPARAPLVSRGAAAAGAEGRRGRGGRPDRAPRGGPAQSGREGRSSWPTASTGWTARSCSRPTASPCAASRAVATAWSWTGPGRWARRSPSAPAAGVTVADLTVQNVRWNGIKLDSDTGVQRATVRNCVLRNIWQRGIKGVKVPEADRERLRPRGCVVEYCLFSNDRPKRFEDDPADTPRDFDGNYVGGIDAMYATGWAIRDNVFVGIRGRTGGGPRRGLPLARLAGLRRRAERDRRLRLGHLPGQLAQAGGRRGPLHRGRRAQQLRLPRAPENGILADYTRDCTDPPQHGPRPGEPVRAPDPRRARERGPPGRQQPPERPSPQLESTSRIELHDNLVSDLTAAFVAPGEGNLHLTAAATGAIDRAAAAPRCGRGPRPEPARPCPGPRRPRIQPPGDRPRIARAWPGGAGRGESP